MTSPKEENGERQTNECITQLEVLIDQLIDDERGNGEHCNVTELICPPAPLFRIE
jgi:hypothetical protein